ncbi:MAG: ribose-phosphate diphosphokinase [Steroidobacteraceae bacterium]
MPVTCAGDPLVFASAQSAAFAQAVAASLGVPLAASEEREFDHGEHKMRPLQEVRGRHVFAIQSIHGDSTASANDRLVRLLFFIGALKDAGAASVTACVPYLAYARKDRRTQPHDPVATRYIAALFESVGCDRLVVLDVHNEAALDNAFRCETVRLEAGADFAATLQPPVAGGRCVVASPDSGGVKRAEQFRTKVDAETGTSTDFAFMHKIREHGQLSGDTLVGDVRGAELLIYDDLIASGATVMRAVKAARSAGARTVRVFATHPVFTAEAIQLFGDDGPDTVTVSDSVPIRGQYASLLQGRLRVCSMAPLFAECIRRLHRGESLAGLARTG